MIWCLMLWRNSVCCKVCQIGSSMPHMLVAGAAGKKFAKGVPTCTTRWPTRSTGISSPSQRAFRTLPSLPKHEDEADRCGVQLNCSRGGSCVRKGLWINYYHPLSILCDVWLELSKRRKVDTGYPPKEFSHSTHIPNV
jgi:hypothetical protein